MFTGNAENFLMLIEHVTSSLGKLYFEGKEGERGKEREPPVPA